MADQALLGPALREPPDEDHEDRHERQHRRRGSPAETQSSPSTTSRTPGVTVAASTSCGRYRTKYGSSASSPRVASVTTDGPSPEASQRGPSATACATTCSRSSATVRVAARCAKRSCTAVTSARDRDDGREPRDRRAQDVQRGAVRDGGAQRVREQQRLGDDQRRRDHAERRGEGDVPAGGSRVPQQARVERPHFGQAVLRAGSLVERQAGVVGDPVRGDPLAEHPVRPALVEQHERGEERGHPRHDGERVVGRRRVGDGQRVGRVERGHDVGVHRAEDQHDGGDDRDGGRGERQALRAALRGDDEHDQRPGRDDDGRPRPRHGVRDLRPDGPRAGHDERHDGRPGRERPGTRADVAVGLQREEHRAVREEDQRRRGAAEQGERVEQRPEARRRTGGRRRARRRGRGWRTPRPRARRAPTSRPSGTGRPATASAASSILPRHSKRHARAR